MTVDTYHLAQVFGIDIGIQIVAYVIALIFQTERFYDITGSATFLISMLYSFSLHHRLSQLFEFETRTSVAVLMILVWTLRLGSFLFTRIMIAGKDRRFDKIKKSPSAFFIAWFLQGVWVFLSSLPVLLLTSSQSSVRVASVGPLEMVAIVGYLFGLFFETISDLQKFVFRLDKKNENRFIAHGFWALSRHPNYFGEITLWAFICFFCWTAQDSFTTQLVSLLSPIFIAFLLTKVSGVPLLERANKRKFGDDPAYQSYVKHTPILIPRLF